MCGIVGWIDFTKAAGREQLESTVSSMADMLAHRGPDDRGFWADEKNGVAFGHRRLAILDLSSHGHQPMISADGRYVLVFNGEIYNCMELRAHLKKMGHRFRGHSDTEVMLTGFVQWGVNESVSRFNGMFAFGLWDSKDQALYLGRDRLGEKPLYYGWAGRNFLFASELKAIKAHPDFCGRVDRDSLTLFFRYNYIPSPYSIYKGINKLPPASLLTVRYESDISEPVSYWSLKQVAESTCNGFHDKSEIEVLAGFENLLHDSIKLRMLSDVPLGAFLSGGIDSATIVAIMQVINNSPVRTFTIGFEEKIYNEAEEAKAVARHLGTDHTEMYVTSKDAFSVIPGLPTLYDEPFADSSQIPTCLVSIMAKQHVTVCLSGDGGDELFGGYNHYLLGDRIWRKIRWMPPACRHAAAYFLTLIPPRRLNRMFRLPGSIVGSSGLRNTLPGDMLHKLAEVIAADSRVDLYRNMISQWKNPNLLVLGGSEPSDNPASYKKQVESQDFIQYMMYQDMVTYLPDDIMAKVDRASMGVSLEVRAPFLDHRIAEFAWKVPQNMKIGGGRGKLLIKKLADKYIPQELVKKPKTGFSIPIDYWLRGPLKEWAEELLDARRIKDATYLNPEPIRKKWDEHQSQERNWQNYLWSVLMFQAWLAEE